MNRHLPLFMKTCFLASFLVPVLAHAAPAVMVDAVPSGGVFVNYATIQVPIKNLEKAESREVEAGLASLVAQLTSFAEQNGVTHICLLSSAAERTRGFMIEAAQAQLQLKTSDAYLVAVLYRNGVGSPAKVTFVTENPDPRKNPQYIRIKKVAVPEGWTSDAWVYFNLPRIQDEALKAGATQIFLTATGKGARSAVIIPGAKVPLEVYAQDLEIQASWYIGDN